MFLFLVCFSPGMIYLKAEVINTRKNEPRCQTWLFKTEGLIHILRGLDKETITQK